MEMRSLYNKDTAPVEKIPEFTTTEKAANRQNFTANYVKLTDMTKFKKIIESTETLQPILNDHDGKQGKGKYPLRELKESGQMIVGLQQHLDEQVGFVSKVGGTHLSDNVYFRKKKYDEMDVVCFDRDKFLRNLHKNDVEDSVIIYNLERKASRENFDKVIKNAEKREIEEEFTRLCINRLSKVQNHASLLGAKESH